MDRAYFFDKLYPLQDEVIGVLSSAETGIWGFCRRLGLPLSCAPDNASSKAAGLFPPDPARGLLSATRADWELIRWIDAPDPEAFITDLRHLGEELALLPPPR